MDIFNYIEKLNWPTIIAMFAITWYFTKEIRESIVKLDADVKNQSIKMDEDIKIQAARSDKLYEMFIDLLKAKKGE